MLVKVFSLRERERLVVLEVIYVVVNRVSPWRVNIVGIVKDREILRWIMKVIRFDV